MKLNFHTLQNFVFLNFIFVYLDFISEVRRAQSFFRVTQVFTSLCVSLSPSHRASSVTWCSCLYSTVWTTPSWSNRPCCRYVCQLFSRTQIQMCWFTLQPGPHCLSSVCLCRSCWPLWGKSWGTSTGGRCCCTCCGPETPHTCCPRSSRCWSRATPTHRGNRCLLISDPQLLNSLVYVLKISFQQIKTKFFDPSSLKRTCGHPRSPVKIHF